MHSKIFYGFKNLYVKPIFYFISMEGPLLKKGWFDKWKPRYIKCDDRFIKIFHSKDSPIAKTNLTLNGCVLKEIPSDQYHQKYVFSVKADDKKLTLAASSEEEMSKWVAYLKRFAKRPSALTTNIKRQSSISAASRKSIVTSIHSDKPALVFDTNQISSAYENEFVFSEICLQFLQLLQDHFDNSPNTPIPGIEIKKISSTERNKVKKNIKASIPILNNKVENIFIPLQCIVDDKNGKSYSAKVEFYLPKHRPLSKFSKSKIQLLSLSLGVSAEEIDKINFFEDNRGRLWVMDSSELANLINKDKTDENKIDQFSKQLDSGAFFVFDSPSLIMTFKTQQIPLSKLPYIYSKCQTNEMKEICMIEMIVRSCKQLFRESLSKDSATSFFNSVFGTSKQSKNMWENKISTAFQAKYQIPVKNNVSKTRLLYAFQYHFNIQFKNTKNYNFNSEKPFSSKDISQFNSTIHHNFMKLSNEIFNKHQDPVDLIRREFYRKAIKVLNERISLLQNLYNDTSELINNDIFLLMIAHLGNDDAAMAEICYTSISSNSNSVALPLASLFMISKAEDQAAFKKLVDDSLSRIRSYVGPNSFIEIEFLTRIAKYDKQNQFTSTSLQFAQQKFGENHPVTLFINDDLAVEEMKKNIPVIQDGYGKKSGQLANYYYRIAEKLIDTNQWREALSYALQSYKIRRLTKKERVVFESIQQVAFLYDELNDERNAITYYESLYSYLKQNDDTMMSQLIVLQNILRMYFREAKIDVNGENDPNWLHKIEAEGLKTNDFQLKSLVSEIESHNPLTFADEICKGKDDKLSYLLKFAQLNPESFCAQFGVH